MPNADPATAEGEPRVQSLLGTDLCTAEGGEVAVSGGGALAFGVAAVADDALGEGAGGEIDVADRTGPDPLLLALALGAMASFLRLDGAWGWNGSVVLLALALAGGWGWLRTRPDDHGSRLIGPLVAALSALGFAITENPTLRTIDAGVFIIALALPLIRPACSTIASVRPLSLCFAVVEWVSYCASAGVLLFARRVAPSRVRVSRPAASPGPIVAGSAAALVLVWLFGSLLRSADATFDQWVTVNVDPGQFFARAGIALAFATVFAGWLHGVFDRPFGDDPAVPPPDPVQLPPATVLTPLAALALLFGIFLAIQVGHCFPAEPPGESTVAEIARRGFFELITVGGLALGVLLVSDSCLRYADRGARTAFTILAALLLVCVGLILCSAIWRMRLYVTRFGWTEQRLFASVFLLWTAFALPWFAATALWGRAARFTSGVLAFGVLLVLSLHLISPERVIVASHLDPREEGAARSLPIDYEYLGSLGIGAIEPLVERFEQIPPAIQVSLLDRWESELDGDRPGVASTWARLRAEHAERTVR